MEELRQLAQFLADMRLEDAGEEVLEAAKACVLDTVALALGARENPMFQGIKNVYRKWDGPQEQGSALWGSGERAALRTAVFLNAMMGHILELDDVHTKSKTHIGTVVIPAAWCLAGALGRSGRDLLEAVVCGYEAMARIGMGFGVSSHRNRGWHVTGTAGTFGAAAACAKLLGFDAEQITAAFGLESCLLVLGGMRGSARILDAPDGGIYPMMSDEYDYRLVSAGLGSVYEILNMDKKPYPCCRSTHCAIDAAIALREAHSIHPEAIREVRVYTYLVGLKQCGLTEGSLKPALPTEAKFSTPYTVACALLRGNVELADFEPERIASGKTETLLKKVQVLEDGRFTKRYPEHWGCRMEIAMEDGSVYETEVADASGSVSAPLTRNQILAKARACLAGYEERWIEGLIEAVMELEKRNELPELGR